MRSISSKGIGESIYRRSHPRAVISFPCTSQSLTSLAKRLLFATPLTLHSLTLRYRPRQIPIMRLKMPLFALWAASA